MVSPLHWKSAFTVFGPSHSTFIHSHKSIESANILIRNMYTNMSEQVFCQRKLQHAKQRSWGSNQRHCKGCEKYILSHSSYIKENKMKHWGYRHRYKFQCDCEHLTHAEEVCMLFCTSFPSHHTVYVELLTISFVVVGGAVWDVTESPKMYRNVTGFITTTTVYNSWLNYKKSELFPAVCKQ